MSQIDNSGCESDSSLDNLRLQSNCHPLVEDQVFHSIEEYVLYLIHRKAYEEAAIYATNKAVLDWGCNVGYGIEVLMKTASSVAGLDVGAVAVESARKRLGDKVEIQLYDGNTCNFASGRFDVVSSFQVIEHITDYERYFSEINRVLTAHGIALFSTPNAAIRLMPGMKPWNIFHVREFEPEELASFLGKWFASVSVFGLFGKRELFEIERNRVERAKQEVLLSTGNNKLSSYILKHYKKTCSWLFGVFDNIFGVDANKLKPLDKVELARFNTSDLIYKDTELNCSLDLLAICRKE
jgi:2-polyprenyl-3-methyl-5-hydroxy-6-metoxy-1,4-benzoquinol methylase